MENADSASTQLKRMSLLFKCMRVLFLILAIFITVFFLLVAIAMILNASMPDEPSVSFGIGTIASAIIEGTVFSLSFFIGSSMFKDISKGETPFSDKQVKRILIVATLVLCYAVFSTIFDNAFPEIFVSSSVVGMDRGSNPTTINLGAFSFSALLYAFSAIFKYGILLQEESDDTI